MPPLAHVPEDRRRIGLVLPFEARESAILGYHDDARYRPADPRQITAAAT